MSNYRRVRRPGATYFFTVTLQNRRSDRLVRHIDLLRMAFSDTFCMAPVHVDAMVILPNHLHAVWTLPEADHDYSERWRKVKHRFSRSLQLHLPRPASKRAKRECGLWQRRFWEHTIRDEQDYRRHVMYCWGNPVKHGLVRVAADWPYSSIHRDIRQGRVDPEWQGGPSEGEFGERRVGNIAHLLTVD